MPPAGAAATTAPEPTDEQPPPLLEDVYFGEPGESSLLYEGQTAYTRPGTDVYLTGHAWAPAARRVTSLMVELDVGPCRKRALVSGDRFWDRIMLANVMTPPLPFERMPLVYERAFGGRVEVPAGKQGAWESRNPVGCGLYKNGGAARGNPAPNIEDPDDLVASLSSRPAPCGFGPIARGWRPRLDFAGTYDEAWVEARAPLWPEDFDERFFCAASSGLTTAQHLIGGERVRLRGVSPAGVFEFPLPARRLVAKARFRGRQERRAMVLDAIHLEPDDRVFTMIWRVAFPVDHDLAEHEVSIVRELDAWEEPVR
jgi:hypothetical protein